MEAHLLMLLLIGQLRFTMAASDVIEDQLRLLQINISTFWDNAPIQESSSLNETTLRTFLRLPELIINDVLQKLQKNVTIWMEELNRSKQAADAIKVRIVESGKTLEDLKALFDPKFQNSTLQLLGNMTLFFAQNQIHDQQQAKINLEQDEIEFIEAIKHKYYQLAAVKFIAIKNESKATELIRKVYRQLDNVDCLLNFTDNLNNMNKTLLVYRTFFNILGGFNLIETCKFFKTRMKLYYDLEHKKMTNDSLDAANKLLSEFDEIMDKRLLLITVGFKQDLIVKIKLHNGLYMPASYVYNVTNRYIDVQQYRRWGRRTAVLSCYPIDCM
ncbi:uncharacterized protein isoform X1 [Rhodnius prolixus]|uniref:Uncharacterized protein n=2 Tax=Rhodnius TaxID=13248 RepID=T1IFH6_RHOPR